VYSKSQTDTDSYYEKTTQTIFILNYIDITSEEAFVISFTYGMICLFNSILVIPLYELFNKFRKNY